MIKKKKKNPVTLVKDNRAGFIQNHQDRSRDRDKGFCVEERNGVNSNYSLGKWKLMATSRVVGQGMENY